MDGMLRNMAGIYITDEDKMLLLYRVGSRVVQPSWCNIGGHFEEFELNNSKACALREVFEETGIKESDITNLRFKYVTLRNKNNEIRQNYYFFADLNNKNLHLKDCNEGILQWVEISKVLERDMPYTAKEVLKHYLSIGRNDNNIYAGVATEKQVVFTELNEF
ncbi:MAG TPA: NUDIX domain-containing protein [Clostridia bacterium]|nr:NUDIX domain-containing protein [Clostridia bacterium]